MMQGEHHPHSHAHSGLHRNNPLDLHWRKDVPQWPGNLDKAYMRLYPHLVDKCLCYQCGAVPCPYDHEAEGKQRLADLEFVKDLARERKDLLEQTAKAKAQVMELQAARDDWKSEKFAMTVELERYRVLEDEWQRQRNMLTTEIERLREIHVDHLKEIQQYKREKEKLQHLQARYDLLEQENKDLQEDLNSCRQRIAEQLSQIRSLEETRDALNQEVSLKHTEIRRLTVQLSESREDAEKSKEDLHAQEALARQLTKQVLDLREEMAQKEAEWQLREASQQVRINELLSELRELREKLALEESDNAQLREEISRLLELVDDLKRKLSGDRRFRHFVDIKREVNDLKEQNESLLLRCVENSPPIPVMKQSGAVRSSNAVRTPAAAVMEAALTQNKHPASAYDSRRPKSAAGRLLRPKSARKVREIDIDDLHSDSTRVSTFLAT